VGSGQILWSRELDSYIGMSIDPYRIYLVDSNSELWALDKSSGATLWKQDALLRRSVTRPILQANYVILGDFDGFLHWFKRDTGKLVARVRMAAADYTDPNLDEREDLLYPKMRDILATPVPRKNELIVVDRHGNSEAFEISYP
jgi:outer membrane protein assembly factor BamB